MSLTVEIVGPEGPLYEGDAEFVSAPAVEGSIGLYAGHEPILAVLTGGTVAVKDLKGERIEMAVSGGFISLDHDEVTIVVDESEHHRPL